MYIRHVIAALLAGTLMGPGFRAGENQATTTPAARENGSATGPPHFESSCLMDGSYSMIAAKPIEMGHVRQLLLDGYVVDSTWNCFRTVHQPRKHPANPLIKPEEAWEGTGPNGYNSVFYDDERKCFRLWAHCSATPDDTRMEWGAYYESQDGIHWTRPNLGLADWQGSKANNLFWRKTDSRMSSLSVVPLPQRLRFRGRFALLYLYLEHGKPQSDLRIALSEDGVRFTDQLENPIMRGRADTHNNFVYNPERDVFMLYRRPPINAHEIRRVAYSESHDLVSWSQPLTILNPDELDPPMFYSMTVGRYQGLYLGFLEMFYNANAGYKEGSRYYRNGRVEKEYHIDIQLAWSRDGIHWDRHPQRPIFLPTGLYPSYDWGMVFVDPEVIEWNDQIYIYYTGSNGLHIKWPGIKDGFCLATLRKDGFVSLGSPGVGYMLTKPLLCPGGKLHINARTEPGGFVRLAVHRGDGSSDGHRLEHWDFDSGPIFGGDSTHAAMEWQQYKDFDSLKGKSIRLHFWLEKAELYSFWFE